MEREVAERFERIEADIAASARMLAVVAQSHAGLQQTLAAVAESTDARMRQAAQSQERLQGMIEGLVESIGRYVDASDARMKRMEENLDTLIRAITAEHTNGHNREPGRS
jgi:septal ring factor EnvC (AmiA/AmiB activator)